MGQCTTECTLKKFLVHFRRPQDYHGQYGFDWLRQSYVEGVETVPSKTGSKTPLCKNPNNLKNEYKKDVKNPIAPYGKEYFPAWLSLFASISRRNKNVSDMTKDGATLDLYIEALEPLTADDTVLEFICNNQFVKISKKRIRLAPALAKPKIKDPDGNKTYYHLPKAINIRCQGGWLSGHTEVKVIAKNGNKKMEVGKLMLYDNRIIKRAEIMVISLITDPINKAVPKLPGYEALIKQRSFNQALIRAEVVKEKTLDLTNSTRYKFFSGLINRLPSSDAGKFLKELRSAFNQTPELTREFGILDNNGQCSRQSSDKNCIGRTVLFLTTEPIRTSVSITNGICTLDGNGVWGDMVVIFADGLNKVNTCPHELGHSFGLPHTFEPNTSYHKFHKGYTENYMDYLNRMDGTMNTFHTKANPVFTFYKWQWDIMQNDKSMMEVK